MVDKSNSFIESRKNSWEDLGNGVKRQIMGYDKNIMMVKVAIEKGTVGQRHAHKHAQTTYIVSGRFEVEIDYKKEILTGGDGFYAPPNVKHNLICLETGLLIDVFSPFREDFLNTKK
jgi:quercetin dioxygenase-like cupin family protein